MKAGTIEDDSAAAASAFLIGIEVCEEEGGNDVPRTV